MSMSQTACFKVWRDALTSHVGPSAILFSELCLALTTGTPVLNALLALTCIQTNNAEIDIERTMPTSESLGVARLAVPMCQLFSVSGQANTTKCQQPSFPTRV